MIGRCLWLVVVCASPGVCAGEDVSEGDVRAAVVRALPYVARDGNRWIEEKKCTSCHRTTFTAWVFGEAARKGFGVDREQLDEWLAWNYDDLLKVNDDGKISGSTNLEGVSQVLWIEQALGHEMGTPQNAELVRLIVEGQTEEGIWSACGQLPMQKRPKPETDAVSTMWHALALGVAPANDATTTVREKAWRSFERETRGTSTEWFVARLLLARQQGEEEQVWTERLRSLQQEDGSWGWLAAEKGDALATGMAVYAMRHAGVRKDDPAVVRAVSFLVESQEPDGRWKVNGTKANAAKKTTETASYWGSCWAAIGLLSVVDESAVD